MALLALKAIRVQPDLLVLREPTALMALPALKVIPVQLDLLVPQGPTALMALPVLKAIQVQPDLLARRELMGPPARPGPLVRKGLLDRKARLDRKVQLEQAEMKTEETATAPRKGCRLSILTQPDPGIRPLAFRL
jgi:hypothetical protein